MSERPVIHTELVVSAFLYGLGALAVVTSISPLVVLSWPYIALAGVPTVRWFRRRRVPVGRGTLRWIAGIAALLTALAIVTALVYLFDGYTGSEVWVLVALAATLGVFLAAAWRILDRSGVKGAADANHA